MLGKQEKRDKWSAPYEQVFYIVHETNGSRNTTRRATDEITICSDVSHFKLVNAVINSADDHWITEAGESNTADPGLEKVTSIPAMGNKGKEHSEEQNREQTEIGSDHIQSSERQTEADPESCRPQRTRRKPSYVKDYVLT